MMPHPYGMLKPETVRRRIKELNDLKYTAKAEHKAQVGRINAKRTTVRDRGDHVFGKSTLCKDCGAWAFE